MEKFINVTFYQRAQYNNRQGVCAFAQGTYC